MLKSFFNSLTKSRASEVPRLLTLDNAEQISGGRFKIPDNPEHVTKVFYDDGINVRTSDPSKSNF